MGISINLACLLFLPEFSDRQVDKRGSSAPKFSKSNKNASTQSEDINPQKLTWQITLLMKIIKDKNKKPRKA
jgi:hypothetical protein